MQPEPQRGKNMLTVTQLARECGISRTTILYYEKEQLLLPTVRSENGYRWYGDKEIERLKAISSYRSYGLVSKYYWSSLPGYDSI